METTQVDNDTYDNLVNYCPFYNANQNDFITY
jgi:hypothetical protein